MSPGKVITFYSYKGGTGRSMALANVAWVLALDGAKVLTIDWDLEAPGLHRYFLPFLDDPELTKTDGIIDLFWSYVDLVLTPQESWPPGIEDRLAFADAQRFAVPLQFPFPNTNACLHFLGAGCQNATYANRVRGFDWTAFYERLGGSDFVQALRERSLQQYDYVLIDSRTGVADTSGICTIEFPHTVVLCFTYNRQSMKGVEAIAKSIRAQRGDGIRLLPVAMRADRGVKGYDQAKEVARELLEPLLISQFSKDFLDLYWKACEVPHYPDFSFQETLAVFKDLPNQRNTLLSDMVWLAETIIEREPGSMVVPDLGVEVRDRYLRRFALRDPRHSELVELLELPPAEAYSRLKSLIASSADDADDQSWTIALVRALDLLTDRLREQGLTEQAVAAMRENVAILRRMPEGNRDAQRLVAANLSKLAAQLEIIGRYQEALTAINDSIQRYEVLVLEVPELNSNLANAHGKLGTLLSGLGRSQEALKVTLQAVSEYKSLARTDPETFEPDLAGCLSNLGLIYNELGEHENAISAITRATEIYEELAQKNPDALEPELARSLNTLARTHALLEEPESALEAVLRAAVIYERLAKKDPNLFEHRLAMGLSGGGIEYTELDLSNRGLAALPDAIGRLGQLQYLDLSGNDLTELPEFIGNFSQLTYLDVSDNELSLLPEFIGRLTKLEGLNASVNQLRELTTSIGRLTNLERLDLSENEITTLPETLGALTNLKELFLSDNQLIALPETLRWLVTLQVLDVSANQLVQLPKSISRIISLERLRVFGNRLTKLPEEVGQLAYLKELDLTGNQLTELPKSLRKLARLEGLYLHGNDGMGLPIEVLGPSWDEVRTRKAKSAAPSVILGYYFRVRGPSHALNEAKLILVGRGGSGKTSILNRLVHSEFKDEGRTEGINITEWKLSLRPNEEVSLHVWDFGGQEIMHATHQFFMTQRSLYLVVLNGREGAGDADAEYWLKLIESFGGDSRVILVLNKIKSSPFDLNRRALQQKYPNIRSFVKTDTVDGTGIDDLRAAIVEVTDSLVDLRIAFPAVWFAIKDELSSLKENYLSFDEYREICERNGESDRKAQEDLAGFLHRLGVALNYKDDPRLQDTHVLNPHWVTNGIYTILNSEQLAAQKGEIHLSDLSQILDERKYPPKMHRFLFDLMRKFELCFSFPADDNHYLIPELLDKQEPLETAAFNPQECLGFQYHYSVLPEGLLPRFIVRTHMLSAGLSRWRSGVILGFEGCQALVKSDGHDRKIFVSVSGPLANRRRLLTVIRVDFERIHSDMRNLQPDEVVPLPDFPDAGMSYAELLVMERNGVKTFPKVAGGSVINIDVAALLNGVDLDRIRRPEKNPTKQTRTIRLFYSYSHRDEILSNELETYLKLLQRQGTISTWHDSKITAAENWKHEIDENLEHADIILLLISADFLASDYYCEIELKRALERNRKGLARVVPVILRPCKWKITEFADLQALPSEGLPVSQWPDRDSAWRNVSEGLERIVEEMGQPNSLS